MDVAVIDWKSLDSKFVRDELYENINAPQWVDFTAPDAAIDVESWFCRPDCSHPKKFEDFYKEWTPDSKRSAIGSEMLPLNERNKRGATLKKRGLLQPIISPAKDLMKHGRVIEDIEHQNPNYSTPPPNNKAKFLKETLKSSTEKRQLDENAWRKEQPRSLRSTLSAKNLLAGGDILNRVTEFCNELKKLATRPKERENMEENVVKDSSSDDFVHLDAKEKERKPLLEVTKENNVTPLKSRPQEKQRRKKRQDEQENTPITVNMKNIHKEESVLQIRTCPPTPQCFSANQGTSKASPTPLRTLQTRTLERGILQELQQRNLDEKMSHQTGNQSHVSTAAAEKEAKPLDVFWFLKPCALSS